MQAFAQNLIYGIQLGSLYALIALGYTMVYGVLRLINFAHGDVYMVGAFIGYGHWRQQHLAAQLQQFVAHGEMQSAVLVARAIG